jgi:hypothetical protein
VRGGVGGTEVQRHRFSQQFTRGKMGSMLLDSLLGSTKCVWCFVDSTRAHGARLKRMQELLSSSLWVILALLITILIFQQVSGIAGLRKGREPS